MKFLLIAFLTACVFAGCIYACSAADADRCAPANAVILWDKSAAGADMVNQTAIEHAFSSIAVKTKRVSPSEIGGSGLEKINLYIVPYGSARKLSDAQITALNSRVRSGACILLDGPTGLAESFGFRDTGTSADVSTVKDTADDQVFHWRGKVAVPTVLFPEGSTSVYVSSSGTNIGGWSEWGKGRCFFLSVPFDPETGLGYGRFPSLPAAVLSACRLKPGRVARDIELYFDPGYRVSCDLDKLVGGWRKSGVRVIHAAAWYTDRKNAYDYAALIEKCHENGILVYAWLELPYVGSDFYKAHPEWREKTADGNDSKPGWRLPMAMEIPECREAVIADVMKLLDSCDWDGVNLAELYFECFSGPEDAANFVPMHPYVIKEFKSRCGYDPCGILDPSSPHYWKTSPTSWDRFKSLRAEMLHSIYVDVLSALDDFRKGDENTGGREVVVTVLDSISAPEIERSTGLDVRSIIGLMRAGKVPGRPGVRKFDFTLNVEDPQSMWNGPPGRYAKIGSIYTTLLSDPGRLMLNMNVLDFRKPNKTPFVSSKQVGAELSEMITSAKTSVRRVIIYSESSIAESDMGLLSAMMATVDCWDERGACIHKDSPCSSFLLVEDSLSYVSANGKCIQVSESGEVPIVCGSSGVECCKNVVKVLNHDVPVMHLLNISGVLKGLEEDAGSLIVRYDSIAPCLVTVDQSVTSLLVDGSRSDAQMWKNDGFWVLRCPSGSHEVKIVSKSRTLFNCQIASSLLSHTIVFAGCTAALLSIALAVSVKLRRRSVAAGGRGK